MTRTYYVIEITVTEKPSPASDKEFCVVDNIKEAFSSLDEVTDYLRDRYGSFDVSRRVKVYVDEPDGGAKRVGFIRTHWVTVYDRGYSYKVWRSEWINVTKHVETINPVILKGKI